MRLPLRHPPPVEDAPLERCAHLEALIEAAIGVPLGPAAARVASGRSRGRHGNALQWHLGLAPHDGEATLDWEDRIELKLVSVWRRGSSDAARLGCDKLKVCDVAIDPWRKLSNVVFVLADRLTRCVVGGVGFRLAGAARERLAAAWRADPHFDHPALFVEAREQGDRSAPAYYLAARWLDEEAVLPAALPGVFPFDAKWWNAARSEHGRDPLATIVDAPEGAVACPRCGATIRYDAGAVVERGWAPARHAMPLGDRCGIHGHFVVAAARLHPAPIQSPEEFRAAIESRMPRERVWRLADRVPEPEDHGH